MGALLVDRNTDTRVEVLETRVGGIEKTLGVVLNKVDTIVEALSSQPKHTPLVDQLRVVAVTASILTGVFTGAGWWLNASLAPDRQRVETIARETEDLAVLRYRIVQLEKTKTP